MYSKQHQSQPSVKIHRYGKSLVQIRSDTTEKLLRVKQNVTKGECIPCNTSQCLSCQQIIAATIFERIQTKEKFNIYHNISCKSNYVIYLLHCLLRRIQYVQKSEAPFHIRLNNNYRKDIKNPNYWIKKSIYLSIYLFIYLPIYVSIFNCIYLCIVHIYVYIKYITVYIYILQYIYNGICIYIYYIYKVIKEKQLVIIIKNNYYFLYIYIQYFLYIYIQYLHIYIYIKYLSVHI